MLAHELIWNRFVNTKGFVDSNVELDRHLEHLNKYVKMELATYQGKLTEKSIRRCSSSYSKMHSVMKEFDEQLSIVPPSGKHKAAQWEDDVRKLAEQYINANLFDFKKGRFHSKFPGFPVSYPAYLNVGQFKIWINLKNFVI